MYLIDKVEYLNEMKHLYSLINQPIDKDRIQAQYEFLKHYKPEEIRSGINELIKKENAIYMPTIHMIIKYIELMKNKGYDENTLKELQLVSKITGKKYSTDLDTIQYKKEEVNLICGK